MGFELDGQKSSGAEIYRCRSVRVCKGCYTSNPSESNSAMVSGPSTAPRAKVTPLRSTRDSEARPARNSRHCFRWEQPLDYPGRLSRSIRVMGPKLASARSREERVVSSLQKANRRETRHQTARKSRLL